MTKTLKATVVTAGPNLHSAGNDAKVLLQTLGNISKVARGLDAVLKHDRLDDYDAAAKEAAAVAKKLQPLLSDALTTVKDMGR